MSSLSRTSTPVATPLFVQLLFDQTNRILLMPFPEKLTRAHFDRAEAALGTFVARRGPTDTIIDFSDVCEDVDTTAIVARAYMPWPAGKKRHVFVVSSDVMEGLFRMYTLHHEAAGFGRPQIVRSLDNALTALGTARAHFDPVTYN
ncbi:MAG: hypothetical protein JSR91_23210 [Proteobacteria bacterium]|nr:hypothetical protein [Pseudomonadota bacterium]